MRRHRVVQRGRIDAVSIIGLQMHLDQASTPDTFSGPAGS